MSRLTLAWAGAGALIVFAALAAALPSIIGHGPNRVSLAIEDVEYLARPAAAERKSGGLRLAAPGEEPVAPGDDTPDILRYEPEFGPPTGAETLAEPDMEFDADDVVITIAGSDQPATGVTAASLTSARSSAPAPVPDPSPALLQNTPFGKIPRVSTDGKMAMHLYRNAFDGGAGGPKVAIIVGGLGLNKALTERAIDELPAEVSLAFAPYAKDLEFWTRKARRAGHEVLIELPMEGYGGNASALGAAGLLTSRTSEENIQRLEWLMSRFGGYFAATNYLGGKFAADPDALSPILTRLREAGVGYVDDTGAAGALMGRTGTAIASVNRLIPPAPDDSARRSVRRGLQALVSEAKRDGAALGKTYAYDATVDELIAWAKTLESEGLTLAPASAALPRRYASR